MISNELLIDTATAYTVTSRDQDRNPVYSEGVTLENIRVVFNDSQRQGANGKDPANTATMYFDVMASKPANFVPLKNMLITYAGRNFQIMEVKPARGTNNAPEFYKAALYG